MKKIILTILPILLYVSFCHSQDTITLKSGDLIQAKVLEISFTEIKYKKFDYLDGPVYTILKSAVAIIHYENGTSENLTKNIDVSNTGPQMSETDMFAKAQKDASMYYHSYSGAGTVTLITGILYLPAGLVPAIWCSSTRPKDKNLNYPRADLMMNPEYSNGYKIKAKQIKQGKVWTNFGIAVGINVIAYLIIFNDQ